jgi:26S proteasome regulatory subunit N5
MSSGEVLKADKDFSKETDAAIPEAEKLGAVCAIPLESSSKLICHPQGDPQAGIDQLLTLEKKTRQVQKLPLPDTCPHAYSQ